MLIHKEPGLCSNLSGICLRERCKYMSSFSITQNSLKVKKALGVSQKYCETNEKICSYLAQKVMVKAYHGVPKAWEEKMGKKTVFLWEVRAFKSLHVY